MTLIGLCRGGTGTVFRGSARHTKQARAGEGSGRNRKWWPGERPPSPCPLLEVLWLGPVAARCGRSPVTLGEVGSRAGRRGQPGGAPQERSSAPRPRRYSGKSGRGTVPLHWAPGPGRLRRPRRAHVPEAHGPRGLQPQAASTSPSHSEPDAPQCSRWAPRSLTGLQQESVAGTAWGHRVRSCTLNPGDTHAPGRSLPLQLRETCGGRGTGRPGRAHRTPGRPSPDTWQSPAAPGAQAPRCIAPLLARPPRVCLGAPGKRPHRPLTTSGYQGPGPAPRPFPYDPGPPRSRHRAGFPGEASDRRQSFWQGPAGRPVRRGRGGGGGGVRTGRDWAVAMGLHPGALGPGPAPTLGAVSPSIHGAETAQASWPPQSPHS